MQTINKLFILTLLGLSLFIISCDKNEDTEPPEITILSPQNNEIYNVGDTINIHFEITENDELHHIDADLLDTDGNKLWHRHWHRHTQFFEWQDQYIVKQEDLGQTLKLVVEADDHNGNEARKEVSVSVE